MKVLEIQPMFNNIVTTADEYKSVQYIAGTDIIDPKSTRTSLKEYQKVLFVGPNIKSVKPGDIVCINPTRFARREYKEGGLQEAAAQHNMVINYVFDFVEVDGKRLLFIQDRDIDFIVTKYEEDENDKDNNISQVD